MAITSFLERSGSYPSRNHNYPKKVNKPTACDWKSITDASLRKIETNHLKISVQHHWRQSTSCLTLKITTFTEWCPVNANKSVFSGKYWNIDNNKETMLNWLIENIGKRMQGEQLKASSHPFLICKGMRQWTILLPKCFPKKMFSGSQKPVLSSRVSGRKNHTKSW